MFNVTQLEWQNQDVNPGLPEALKTLPWEGEEVLLHMLDRKKGKY